MKIGVIGAGAVGVGVCNYVLTLGMASELVLLDRNLDKAEGEVFDFQHTAALTFSKNTDLIATDDYSALKDANIVVLTAGAQIQHGQSRLDIAEINARIGVDIAKQVEAVAPNAILIVVTNPCDIVTHFIAHNTHFNGAKLISSGCVIDTARLMTIVAQRVQLDPKNISGLVVGEHGSNCFIPERSLGVAGQNLDAYCEHNNLEKFERSELLTSVQQAGFEIFHRKNNTAHGIAASVFRIIQAIVVNERSVLPVGTVIHGEYGLDNVVMSLPTIVGKNGAESVLSNAFDQSEQQALSNFAIQISESVAEVARLTGLKA
ncbi:lactate/malate family dehydrogenase [Vibrio gallicus]|uniref:lactate/malate family dehydrogenase n=1 Tax=Vibrio gallicus TaxID=190897 RepID=UPI0021C35A2D|nr:L-lactate dehydrogenase [Vibrio gallicus]